MRASATGSIVEPCTFVGSTTSMLQPAKVSPASPATAIRRDKRNIERMIEPSELDVEPDDIAAIRWSRKHVDVVDLVDTGRCTTNAEHVRVIILVCRLPEAKVSPA